LNAVALTKYTGVSFVRKKERISAIPRNGSDRLTSPCRRSHAREAAPILDEQAGYLRRLHHGRKVHPGAGSPASSACVNVERRLHLAGERTRGIG
jgi:hypothetical protein